jgi:hypothetical protein
VPGDAGTELPEGGRPAFYALRPGGWRDYWTLLHPPYTVWHLSHVAMGAAAAPRFSAWRLGLSVLAFFFAIGLSAHALDELAGRPLGTRIPARILQAIAGVGMAAAVALGVYGVLSFSVWLLVFMAFGIFILVAYNLELFGGRFHNDAWFAISWGAFPALTGYFAQSAAIRWPALPVAAACLFLAAAQRRLSTPVRMLRRKVASLEGRMRLRDGTEVGVDEALFRAAPEAALRILSVAVTLLAIGLVGARLTANP